MYGGDGEIDVGGLAWPGEGRRRRGAADELDGRWAGVDDDGSAAETSSTAGRRRDEIDV